MHKCVYVCEMYRNVNEPLSACLGRIRNNEFPLKKIQKKKKAKRDTSQELNGGTVCDQSRPF